MLSSSREDSDDNMSQVMAAAAWQLDEDEEEIMDFNMPMPLRLGRANRRRSVSGVSVRSNRSTRSRASSGTAGPGDVACMTFKLMADEHAYGEEQLREIVSLQRDGSAVVNGILTPLAITCSGHPGVLPGDTIQQISDPKHGIIGDTIQQLELALCKGGEVDLLIATRPPQFDVDIFCGDNFSRALALLVTIERQHGDRIKVQSVRDRGLLRAWNEENPHCQVMPGDWITHVNGEAKSARELADDIRNYQGFEDNSIQLTIHTRPRTTEVGMSGMRLQTKSRMSRKGPGRVRVDTGDWK